MNAGIHLKKMRAGQPVRSGRAGTKPVSAMKVRKALKDHTSWTYEGIGDAEGNEYGKQYHIIKFGLTPKTQKEAKAFIDRFIEQSGLNVTSYKYNAERFALLV